MKRNLSKELRNWAKGSLPRYVTWQHRLAALERREQAMQLSAHIVGRLSVHGGNLT